MSYSGYTYDELLRSNNKYQRYLLKYIDILIDGRYDKRFAADETWRGSKNQRLHFLTGKYSNVKNNRDEKNEVEVNIYKNGSVIITGFPDAVFLNEIKSQGIWKNTIKS